MPHVLPSIRAARMPHLQFHDVADQYIFTGFSLKISVDLPNQPDPRSILSSL